MRNILITLAFFILSLDSIAQTEGMVTFRSSEQEILKKNKLRRILGYLVTLSPKNKVMDSSLVLAALCDSNGILTEELTYYPGVFDTKKKYYRNEKGQLVRTIVYSGDMSSVIHTLEYEYDSVGNQVLMYDFNDDTTKLTIEKKEYDSSRNLVSLYKKVDENDNHLLFKYYYNADNKLMKMEEYNKIEQVVASIEYSYDKASGKEFAFLVKNDKRTLYREQLFDYRRRLVQATSYNGTVNTEGYSVNTQNHYYNEVGLLSKIVFYYNGEEKSRINIVYL